jgi:hypothetical protein
MTQFDITSDCDNAHSESIQVIVQHVTKCLVDSNFKRSEGLAYKGGFFPNLGGQFFQSNRTIYFSNKNENNMVSMEEIAKEVCKQWTYPQVIPVEDQTIYDCFYKFDMDPEKVISRRTESEVVFIDRENNNGFQISLDIFIHIMTRHLIFESKRRHAVQKLP